MTVRVLLTKKFFTEDLEYLHARIDKKIDIVIPSGFNIQSIEKSANNNIHVLLGEVVTKNILDRAKQLKLIQIPWTGIDRLDLALLRQYDIPVCNSHSNAYVVAEYAIGLMMAVVKKIPFHDRMLRIGKWCRPYLKDRTLFSPPDLIHNKNIGFLGFGKIAKKIAELLSCFSNSFLAFDIQNLRDTKLLIKLFIGEENIKEFISRLDILFLTLPLTEKTKGMLDYSLLSLMKQTSYLVNISRGEIIPEGDLFRILSEKGIAGAAIDTWYSYPSKEKPDSYTSEKYPFHELDNLVLSPHRAGFAAGMKPHLDDVVENLNRLARGMPLINRVNINAGY